MSVWVRKLHVNNRSRGTAGVRCCRCESPRRKERGGSCRDIVVSTGSEVLQVMDTVEPNRSRPSFLQQRRPPALRKVPIKGRRARPKPFRNLCHRDLRLGEHRFRHRQVFLQLRSVIRRTTCMQRTGVEFSSERSLSSPPAGRLTSRSPWRHRRRLAGNPDSMSL